MLEKVIHAIATGNLSQEQAIQFASKGGVSLSAKEANALQVVVRSHAWKQLSSASSLDALLEKWPEAYDYID
jgi:hypothetical protein